MFLVAHLVLAMFEKPAGTGIGKIFNWGVFFGDEFLKP